MSDGTTTYSTAVYRSVIGGIKSVTDEINRQITQKVWESDIESYVDEYDQNTVQTIRDNVTSVQTDLSGIHTSISSIETDVSQKANQSTVVTLTNRVQTVEEDADEYKRTVAATYATLVDLDNIEVGGRNLVLKSDTEKTSKNTTTNYNLSAYGTTVVPG